MSILAHIDLLRRLRDRHGVNLSYEAVLEANYRRFLQPGDVVIDIGAHTGRHTLAFVEIVGASGRVIGFEPLPFAYQKLAKRLRRADGHATAHNLALSDFAGESTFTYARGTPEESGLVERIFNRPDAADPTEITVAVDRLDRFTAELERLDYVKVDVEGGEIGVLRGAADALQRLRPVFSVEYGFPGYSRYGHAAAALYDLAAEHGYAVVDLFGNPVPDRATWLKVCDQVYWDYYLVPKERVEAFRSAL